MKPIQTLQKKIENAKWVIQNYESLKKDYLNKWVAVKDEKVIDYDKNYKSLLSRLKEKYKFNPTDIAIEYISTKPSLFDSFHHLAHRF